MRRRYAADGFRRLVERIAKRVPDCGIGTDVICGFPGETDAAFQDTFDALAELPITYIHPFTYSPRPGSESARWKDDVPPDAKKRRVGAVKRLARDKGRAFRERHVGRVAGVLPEGPEGTGVDRQLHQGRDRYGRSGPHRPCTRRDPGAARRADHRWGCAARSLTPVAG